MTITDWILLGAVLAAAAFVVERFIIWIKRRERRSSEEDE
jgi:hypothetical protein